MPSFTDRLMHAWNAFNANSLNGTYIKTNLGASEYTRPDRTVLTCGNDRTIINSIYTRIAIDVASIDIFESLIDDNGNIKERLKTGLTEALMESANIDQTGRALRIDACLSLFDEGSVALVPVETDINPEKTSAYDVIKIRVGKITEWFPKHVRVNVYNEETGRKEDLIMPKDIVAIIENPFYSIMNQPNATLKRLVRKLNLLDMINEQTGSGKLDMIIQLPYVIKSEARKAQAEERRQEIIDQLANSKYGIAYTDGTEKITQLSHSLENNLQAQIESDIKELYKQLGLTEEIFNGTANEQTMLNYYDHTIEPIMMAFADELKRKFLTKTARTRGHSISFLRNPFKLVPVNNLAEIADKFTRNEILTSNEVRALIGFKPSDQASADELRNKNINQSAEDIAAKQALDNGEQIPEQDVEQQTMETPAEEPVEETAFDRWKKQNNFA